eukprot:scaffold54241_cov63-Phaeocystis_antarctica.AAC.3
MRSATPSGMLVPRKRDGSCYSSRGVERRLVDEGRKAPRPSAKLDQSSEIRGKSASTPHKRSAVAARA